MRKNDDNAAEHLAMLITYQAWRRGDDSIPQPHPTDIGKALDWAIRELEKAKRGPVHNPKRTP